jgi:hypothetical protein
MTSSRLGPRTTLRAPILKMLGAVVFAFAVALPARAQNTGVTNSTSTPLPGSGHDYINGRVANP